MDPRHHRPDRESLWLATGRQGPDGEALRGHGGHGGGSGGARGGSGGHRAGFGGGDDGFSRGRKFSAEELHLLLIALLADAPRHGYELIKLLETRSNGFYTPSPGMVYPALTYLEELGLASVETVGNRRRYSITAQGRGYLDENRERIEVIWAKLNFLAKKMGLVRRALAGEREDEGTGDRSHAELKAAFHRLKILLIERRPASPEQALRIVAVLEQAAADIAALADANPKETG